MIFYRVLDPQGRLILCKTQADAKKIDKKFDPATGTFDVPTDKDGLMEILQDLIDRAQAITPAAAQADASQEEGFQIPEHEIVPTGSTFDTPPAPAAAPAPVQQLITHGLVVDFIIEDATGAQIEDIFTALGCRFAEANRKLSAQQMQIDEAATAG